MDAKVTSPQIRSVLAGIQSCSVTVQHWTMDSFDSLSASDKAEATELQRMIAIEQQKAQFQAQVCMLTVLMCIL